ncbi:unnamed protein product, partial [Amoebophrya sp. A120]
LVCHCNLKPLSPEGRCLLVDTKHSTSSTANTRLEQLPHPRMKMARLLRHLRVLCGVFLWSRPSNGTIAPTSSTPTTKTTSVRFLSSQRKNYNKPVPSLSPPRGPSSVRDAAASVQRPKAGRHEHPILETTAGVKTTLLSNLVPHVEVPVEESSVLTTSVVEAGPDDHPDAEERSSARHRLESRGRHLGAAGGPSWYKSEKQYLFVELCVLIFLIWIVIVFEKIEALIEKRFDHQHQQVCSGTSSSAATGGSSSNSVDPTRHHSSVAQSNNMTEGSAPCTVTSMVNSSPSLPLPDQHSGPAHSSYGVVQKDDHHGKH